VAAQVNWVLPYKHLRTANVLGTAELFRALVNPKKAVHFNIVSTVGATGVDMALQGGSVGFLDEMGGYALSKWASDQLAFHARKQRVPVAVFRLPLVTPHSTSGAANMEDELSRTIHSCLQIKAVPILDKAIHSSPLQTMAVDKLVASIVNLSQQQTAYNRNLVQFTTKEGSSWFDVMEMLHDVCGLQKISLQEWVQLIQNKPATLINPIVNIMKTQFTAGEVIKYDAVASSIGQDCVETVCWNVNKDLLQKVVNFVAKVK